MSSTTTTPFEGKFPVEIINKIYSYIGSPTSTIIKQSLFYNSSFPFFLLRQVVYFPQYPEKIRNDFHFNINLPIRASQLNNNDDRYVIFFEFNNYDDTPRISEHTGVSTPLFRGFYLRYHH